MASRGEQVHRVKPLLQRRVGALKGRVLHRVNVMPACWARISRNLLEPCKLALVAAFRAFKWIAETRRHQMLKASGVIRETTEKILNARAFWHRDDLQYLNIGVGIGVGASYVKGIIAKTNAAR